MLKEILSQQKQYLLLIKQILLCLFVKQMDLAHIQRELRISSMNKSVLYRKALYAASGLKTDNLRYRPVRSAASSAMDANEKNYRSGLAVDSLILFTNVGYRFSMTMTLVMMLISVFVLAYTLITYFTSHPVEGWTTTILFLSVSFFGLFAILTIIIKYLQLLIDMIFKRRRYSFERIEKLTK